MACIDPVSSNRNETTVVCFFTVILQPPSPASLPFSLGGSLHYVKRDPPEIDRVRTFFSSLGHHGQGDEERDVH